MAFATADVTCLGPGVAAPADGPATSAEPTDAQIEDLARAWFTRDWEYDEPDEWDRLDAYVRVNYRTGARWLWKYVEEHR